MILRLGELNKGLMISRFTETILTQTVSKETRRTGGSCQYIDVTSQMAIARVSASLPY